MISLLVRHLAYPQNLCLRVSDYDLPTLCVSSRTKDHVSRTFFITVYGKNA